MNQTHMSCRAAAALIAALPAAAMADWASGDPYAGAAAIPLFAHYRPSGQSQVTALAFENFAWVPGAGGGVIDTLGGFYHQFNTTPAFADVDKAYWEIRSGVGAGVAGTLVASGVGVPTSAPTSFVQGGGAVIRTTLDIADFALPAGNYWFGMAIGDTPEIGWFVANTTGTNGVGGPLGDNVSIYYQSNPPNTPSWDYVDIGPTGMGFTGVDAAYFINEVPAPGVISVGLFALAGMARRRKR